MDQLRNHRKFQFDPYSQVALLPSCAQCDQYDDEYHTNKKRKILVRIK